MSYLNTLLEQTGEVIITEAQHASLVKSLEYNYINQKPPDENMLNLAKQILLSSRQTSELLHKNVMDIRRVEFKETMTTIQRLVRDLAKSQGKPIRFKASGSETFVDKTIIEEFSGALIHIIRNSVDHGIEPPDDRIARNKNPEGTISIDISESDEFIFITVADDGGGIDLEKVCEKAIERSLTTPEKLKTMTDEEKYQFIFLPGFSTKEKVSEVSGRGVGMDVVKNSVDRLNGSIIINSSPGQWTRFTFKIPVISAVNIIDALIVRSAGSIYAMPVSAVVSIITVTEEDITLAIDKFAVKFRGQTLFIYDLKKLWNKGASEMSPRDIKNIVVIIDRDEMVGICVDDFLPSQKVVVKKLDDYFSKVRAVAGTTLLGGNDIGLILDVAEVINIALGREPSVKKYCEKAGILAEAEETAAAAKLKSAHKKKTGEAAKKYKVEIDSEISQAAKVEIALNYQCKLLDAYTAGKPVYEIDLMLETDIIKAQKTKFDIYKIAKSTGELLCVIPMTSQLPENFKDFSPENFDMSIKFFILSRMSIDEIASKMNIEKRQIRNVGITVKEEARQSEEKVFNEIELLEDYEAFAIDTQKNLSAMSQNILALEDNMSDAEAVKEIFRAVHTLKSATAMLGIKNMSDIAHILESMLDKIRSGLEPMTEEKIELLFDVLKFFEECMESIKNGVKPVVSNAAVKEKIVKFTVESPEKKLIRVIDVKTEKFQISAFEDLVIQEKVAGGMALYSILVEFIPDLPMKMVNAFMLFRSLKEYGELVKTIPTMEEIDKGNFEMHFKILFLASCPSDKFKSVLMEEEIKTFEISNYVEN